MNGYLVEIYDNESNEFLQQNAEGVHFFVVKQTESNINFENDQAITGPEYQF